MLCELTKAGDEYNLPYAIDILIESYKLSARPSHFACTGHVSAE
jgi:hypothetical protein